MMTKALHDLPQHPTRALMPPLAVMESLGYDSRACLAGTGVTTSQLNDPGSRISLQQELRFYRNILELTGDPVIGLKLGEPFIPQRYGLFGYALLSAETFRHALVITENFGRLTFSFFSFHFGVEGRKAWFSMTDPPELEPELLNLYFDRDLSAARVDFKEILGRPFALEYLHLPHDGQGHQQVYRDHFGCDIQFCAADGRFVFSSEFLDQPLPQSDPDSSRHLQQQCQMLIAKLTTLGRFVDEVRLLILARPGFFPDIDYVAAKLGMSTRTLRRRLKEENSSYRELLDEVRFGLAREYLGNTELPLDEVSRLLGYTEPGNFSHAFRRWSGESPSAWRQLQLSTNTL
jgi:AraC-like DNA-binding protein